MAKILVIDDNMEFTTLMSYYFTVQKYTVQLANSGREGLEKAKSFKPDIILLDVMMPDVGGIEVLRELQTYEGVSSVPVIVLTGTYFDKNMSDIFRQEPNCREFLSKTAELSYISKKIETFLKKN